MQPDLNPKVFDADVEKIPTRFGYGEALLELGERDPRIVVLTADLAESTRVLEFAKKYPNRFIECGVAEQNMMGIAAGLASCGKIPFVSSYAVFCPGRAWDQMRVSVAYSNLPVKVIGAHTGVSVGPDGATHQALEDMAITRCLPNVTVIAPCDSIETKKAVLSCVDINGPVYIRFAREKTPVITKQDSGFEIGVSNILWRSGGKKKKPEVAIVACGPLVYESLLAAKSLEEHGIGSVVVNNHTIKPIDGNNLLKIARECGAVVTVEEHQILGGLGSAVCEYLSREYPVLVERVGMRDSFGESGQMDELIAKYKMDSKSIMEACISVIGKKRERM